MGKINSGVIKVGDVLKSLTPTGQVAITGKCTKIMVRKGLEQVSVEMAGAGQIVSLAGMVPCLLSISRKGLL